MLADGGHVTARTGLLGETVVPVAGLQQADDAGPPGVKGAAFVPKATANGARDGVLVDLADVLEKVAALSAPVIPLLEELLDSCSVAAEACRPLKAVETSPIISLPSRRWAIYSELVLRPGAGAKT
jgi:hypothetical protein